MSYAKELIEDYIGHKMMKNAIIDDDLVLELLSLGMGEVPPIDAMLLEKQIKKSAEDYLHQQHQEIEAVTWDDFQKGNS